VSATERETLAKGSGVGSGVGVAVDPGEGTGVLIVPNREREWKNPGKNGHNGEWSKNGVICGGNPWGEKESKAKEK